MGIVRPPGMAEAEEEAFVPKVMESDSFADTSPTPSTSRTLLSSLSLLKSSGPSLYQPGLVLALLLLAGACMAEEQCELSKGGSCLGGMREKRAVAEQGTNPTPTTTESTTSVWECDLSKGCEGYLTKIPTSPTPSPPPGVCPADTESVSCSKIIEMNTTCVSCGSPKPLMNNTIVGPKKLCDGDNSFKTVYNQRCTTMKTTNSSSCMMGSEGFSWCSTEHLWWRDDHWFDWDLCSLCSAQSSQVLTTSGFECAGPCHNRHNNHESLAPRCKIKNPENDVDGIGMDYCTACEGAGCPDAKSAPRDERPGNEVGQISWLPGEIKPAEEESDRSQDYYNYDYDNYDLD